MQIKTILCIVLLAWSMPMSAQLSDFLPLDPFAKRMTGSHIAQVKLTNYYGKCKVRGGRKCFLAMTYRYAYSRSGRLVRSETRIENYKDGLASGWYATMDMVNAHTANLYSTKDSSSLVGVVNYNDDGKVSALKLLHPERHYTFEYDAEQNLSTVFTKDARGVDAILWRYTYGSDGALQHARNQFQYPYKELSYQYNADGTLSRIFRTDTTAKHPECVVYQWDESGKPVKFEVFKGKRLNRKILTGFYDYVLFE